MPAKKKTAPVKLIANPRGSARVSKKPPLTPAQLKQIDAYWRASNYLTACQLYLLDNPLLERPLTAADLKQTIVGHWGTCPGQNFIYTHLDRVIKRDDLDMIYLSGPGHGGNAMVAQDWLDGSYTEVYPNITRDKDGMKKLFKRFSFPGGIPSHVAPETPGSIHEGGELGYSLAHAFGAVADNPDLIAACVVGDGEAETGPLATSWHGNKFMNPITDGAVLPILHLNGFKIANPTIFSRMSHEEVESFFRGCGWEPRFVEGSDPAEMHQKMAATVDWAIRAFGTVLGPWAGWLVSVSLGLFAFTSVLGSAVQAETVISFLLGRAAVRPCQVLYGLAVFFGAVLPMETVLQLADLSNALMALPNLMCLILLSGEIAADCRKFRAEK